ncbi:M50 family metallopeptidase [Acutalibacter intestini]|uniref:M50 family metallopeptidase n=1 Tax=Acutalibacter intestini TaxID=3093659 RepID=UPI002AC8FF74|nr:M50 family metallopeptidase [Acutalibacter sp. M00204]
MHILTVALLIIIGVLLFGFVIFFHELGHFLLAKAGGIKVNEFALGMGPKLLSFQRGETTYALRLLPIGGYCAMEGEDEESGDSRAFGNKPVWKRFLTVAAGGVFNIVLGFVLMLAVLAPEEVFATTTLSKFTKNSHIQAAGAQVGDRIVEIDGYAVYTSRDLSFAMAMADPEGVNMVVEREGQRVDLGSFPMGTQTLEDGTTAVALEFYVEPEQRSFLGLVRRAGADTFSMARMVVESLKGLVTGRFGLNEVAGPVGTAQAISQAAGAGLSQGFGQAVSNIVMMIIMITVNLGIVNLLPLPALDGGRLLFLIWEGVTHKPVPAKYEGYVHAAGFILLIGLMILITAHDIFRIVTG